jgi:hypothetical protein
MSLFRRAGALIARFFTSPADPAASAGEFQLYSKDDGGQSQLFGRSDDGTVYQITPPPTDDDAVIFDDSVPGTNSNIRSDRAANQSPIDNTQSQITNLGSQDGLWNGAAYGATGIASTIGGGDDNSAGPVGYETVSGGAGNIANGDSAIVAGGFANQALGSSATVGGGDTNLAQGSRATVAGGLENQAINDSAAIGGGESNIVQGFAGTIPGGSGNFVKGDYALAEGFGTTAEASASHAEGDTTFVQFDAPAGHAEGSGTNASGGEGAHAEGYQTNANQRGAHSEGVVTNATGQGAHSEGVFTTANQRAAHAEGENTIAVQEKAHAEGDNTTALGWASHSQGLNSYANGDGVHAHACGPGTSATGLSGVQGSTQNRVIEMTGETGGAAAGESVELDFGYITSSNKFTFGVPLDDMGYTIVVYAIARGKIGGVYRSQSFRQMFSVLVSGGVATLEASGVQEKIGSAAAVSWTLVGSIAAGPTRFRLVFSTGATTSRARISAKVVSVEIYNPV